MTRPTYCRGTGQPTDKCDCLRCPTPPQVKLRPCPFCEGPPVPTVQLDLPPLTKVHRDGDYGEEGLSVSAYVFCHECGAQGPHHDAILENAEEYDDALEMAVRLWQQRDSMNRPLYDGGEAEGLNLFPRSEPLCPSS